MAVEQDKEKEYQSVDNDTTDRLCVCLHGAILAGVCNQTLDGRRESVC